MSQAPQAVRAVVFAYHNVGARCLRVLLAHGVDVALVVTHADNPAENIWFESVAEVARDYDLPVATPDEANTRGFAAQLRALQAEFLFGCYYREMLKGAMRIGREGGGERAARSGELGGGMGGRGCGVRASLLHN